jgi:hypothetical protein
MVRTLVSFKSRFWETTWWTASTAQGPVSQTTCMTSFSSSVKGERTCAPDLATLVMVQTVPSTQNRVKRFLIAGLRWDEFLERGQANAHWSEFLFAELFGTTLHHPFPLLA